MAREPRMLYGESGLVEISSRTQHGRYLLRPSAESNAIIVGVLGRAQAKYGVYVHAFIVLSNHFHLLMSVLSAKQMAGFSGYFKSNVARELGRLHDWRESFWGRRYHHLEVAASDEDQAKRFMYILENGCKEGLVGSPLDWPGVSSAQALYRGEMAMKGLWRDRAAEYRARVRGQRKPSPSVETVYLSPLPFLARCSAEERRQYVVDAVERVEQDTARMHERNGTKPLGARAILHRKPHDKPKEFESSPSPRFQATDPEDYALLESARTAKVAAYRAAAARLKGGETDARFPDDCFPPPQPYVESLAPT